MYDLSKGNPLVFVHMIIDNLNHGESQNYDTIIENDIKTKLQSLDNDQNLWKAAFVCSFMGTFGIMPILLHSMPSSKIVECCNIGGEYIVYLSDIDFLYNEKGGYQIHELWALEFLIYLYSQKFNIFIRNYPIKEQIRIKQLVENESKQLISYILNVIGVHNHLSIINKCFSFDDKRSNRIFELVMNNYVIPDTLNDTEKSQVYFGLATLYRHRKEYDCSLRFLDKALRF